MPRRGRCHRGLGTGGRVASSSSRAVGSNSHVLGTASSVPPPSTVLLGRKRKSMVVAPHEISVYFLTVAHSKSDIILFSLHKIGDRSLPLLNCTVTAFNRKKRRFQLDLLRSGYAGAFAFLRTCVPTF